MGSHGNQVRMCVCPCQSSASNRRLVLLKGFSATPLAAGLGGTPPPPRARAPYPPPRVPPPHPLTIPRPPIPAPPPVF